jgi:hypothetical protein
LGSVSTAALDLARLSSPVPQWVVEPLLRTVLREHGLQLPDGTPSDQQRLRYLLVAFIRGAASLDEVEGPLHWAVVDAQEPTPPQRKLISAAEEWQAAPAPERRRIAERVRREVAVHLDLGQL